jgi:outer membrane protein assembly factor BamB
VGLSGCATLQPFVVLLGIPASIIQGNSITATVQGQIAPGVNNVPTSVWWTFTLSSSCGGAFTATATPNNGPANPLIVGPSNAALVTVTYNATGTTLGPCTLSVTLKDASVSNGQSAMASSITNIIAPSPNLYVASFGTDQVLRYDGSSGAFIDVFVPDPSGGLDQPIGLDFGTDSLLYVSYAHAQKIRRESSDCVTAGSGGLNQPHGFIFGPDGNIYSSSSFTNQILRYNGTTCAFMDVFVSAGSGGLNRPVNVIFGPDGNLYVSSSASHEVIRYNGTTGAFMNVFVCAGCGGLINPSGLTFGSDGNLYVADYDGDRVLRYNGTTGTFIDSFVPPGSGGLDGPVGLVFGSAGNLYVASSGTDEILRYNGTTGAFMNVFVSAGSGGLSVPNFLVFK